MVLGILSAGVRRGAGAAAATATALPLLAHHRPPAPPAAPLPHRRQQHTVPDNVQRAFEGAPFAAALIPGAGRGLVAARRIEQGELVMREAPFLCAPALDVRHKVGLCSNVVIRRGGMKFTAASYLGQPSAPLPAFDHRPPNRHHHPPTTTNTNRSATAAWRPPPAPSAASQ